MKDDFVFQNTDVYLDETLIVDGSRRVVIEDCTIYGPPDEPASIILMDDAHNESRITGNLIIPRQT